MSGRSPPTQGALRRGEAATWGAHRETEPTQATERPRMTLRGFKLIRKGSLIGFASVALPAGLEIDDIPVLMTHGRAWATLPARPVISSDGRVAKIPGTSKTQYVSFLRWRDRALSTAFSERVVALVRARHPGAFDDGDAP